MFIVKCSCGRFSTLDNNFFGQSRLYVCPNCRKRLELGPQDELWKLPELLERESFKLYLVPDDTTYDFHFHI